MPGTPLSPTSLPIRWGLVESVAIHENALRKKTKIVATLGPASSDEKTLRRMIRNGLDVIRINFSHGEHDEHATTIERARRIATEEGRVIATMCDIQGPKIRIGALEQEPLELFEGDIIRFTPNGAVENSIPLPHLELYRDVKAGMQLLLDDGSLELLVEMATPDCIECQVVVGGPLHSRKGVTAPKASLSSLSAITDKDRQDVEFALDNGTDYIAMSFVRGEDDIRELRWLLRHLQKKADIIAKIEKREALQNIDEIVAAADGVMVARGDLGLETPAEEVPYQQKRIIQLCNEAAKPVITATQMLSSMINLPRPTRADASDVYNAIVDGTDAVMLSNETAVGKYPAKAVRTMANISVIAEAHLAELGEVRASQHGRSSAGKDEISDAISSASYEIAQKVRPRAIVTATMSGYTARHVARARPRAPIICVTPMEQTHRRMALVWGVQSLMVPEFDSVDSMNITVIRKLYEEGYAKRGDVLVILAGTPFGFGGRTNMMQIHRVGDSGELDDI